jgi:SAM-dependent methyltransferase
LRWRGFGWAWNEVGRRDPLRAILRNPADPESVWNIDDFFATGRSDAARLMAEVSRLAPGLARRRALDFGCGVGRVTRALSDYFDSVVGVDVAPSMVRQARELHRDDRRCRFFVNRAHNLHRFGNDTFDLVYSRLVLQHIPAAGVRRYLPELVRVLAPRGILMIQIPDVIGIGGEEAFCNAPVANTFLKQYCPRTLVRAYRRVRYRLIVDDSVAQDMFGLHQSDVVDALRLAEASVLEVRPDQSHGLAGLGFEYWATKA